MVVPRRAAGVLVPAVVVAGVAGVALVGDHEGVGVDGVGRRQAQILLSRLPLKFWSAKSLSSLVR